MRRSGALVLLYAAAAIAWLVLVNAREDNTLIATIVLAAASLVLGWGIRNSGSAGVWAGVMLPLALIPLGLPFGDPNQSADSPVALLAVVAAAISMVLILAAVGCHSLYGHFRSRGRANEA